MTQQEELRKILQYARNHTILNLAGKGLFELPPEIGQLQQLTRLNLKQNHLDTLPPEIGQLKNLRELWLDGNKLSTLPEEIGQLKQLRWLSLNDNQINELPESLAGLETLEILELNGNQLPHPAENQTRKPAELIDFILQNQERRRINTVKLLVLGEPGAGKTSLIRRLVERRFNPDEPSSSGITVQRWPVQVAQKRIQINLWDFGPEVVRRGISHLFLSERSFYLMVWDAGRDKDPEKLENWLKLIQFFGGNSPLIIVLNKTDLLRAEIDRKGLQQRYPNIRAFVNASALDDNGIAELRSVLKNALPDLENMKTRWEPGWLNVKTRLELLKRHFIGMQEYEALCDKEDIDKAGQKDLLQWLHDLGTVTHFQGDIRLHNTIVLRPEWISEAIGKILDANPPAKNRAVLSAADLSWILSGDHFYPRTQYLYLIHLMKSFELCFDLEDNSDREYLVPQWLPARPEADNPSYRQALAFQYHYRFLPGDIIPKLIAKMFPFIVGNAYWQNGFVVSDPFNQALVETREQPPGVSIYVGGRSTTRRDFLARIRGYFDYIHALFPGLEVQERVPLPDQPDVSIDYRHLLTLEEKGIEQFIPEGRELPLAVAPLLNGSTTSRLYYQQRLQALRKHITQLDAHSEAAWLRYARERDAAERSTLENRIRELENERDKLLREMAESEQALAQF